MPLLQKTDLSNTSFEVKSDSLVEEEIDGEVIIINLTNGKYYSLRDEAAIIWSYIRERRSVEKIASLLHNQRDAALNLIVNAVCEFLAQLQEEELIDYCKSSEPRTDSKIDSLNQGVEKSTFSAPVLQLYTDMQDLLLLDPIHEVAETGWPSVVKNKG